MDRKHCVLFYSNYSKASLELLNYIKELPLDFPKVTGLSLVCIDNDHFKQILIQNGIEFVPSLIVEYFGGKTTKQKFETEYIYMWIDQVMAELIPQSLPESDVQAQDELSVQAAVPKATPQDVTSLAQQMAKERDSFISEAVTQGKRTTNL
jgi:hypothetical protein